MRRARQLPRLAWKTTARGNAARAERKRRARVREEKRLPLSSVSPRRTSNYTAQNLKKTRVPTRLGISVGAQARLFYSAPCFFKFWVPSPLLVVRAYARTIHIGLGCKLGCRSVSRSGLCPRSVFFSWGCFLCCVSRFVLFLRLCSVVFPAACGGRGCVLLLCRLVSFGSGSLFLGWCFVSCVAFVSLSFSFWRRGFWCFLWCVVCVSCVSLVLVLSVVVGGFVSRRRRRRGGGVVVLRCVLPWCLVVLVWFCGFGSLCLALLRSARLQKIDINQTKKNGSAQSASP